MKSWRRGFHAMRKVQVEKKNIYRKNMFLGWYATWTINCGREGPSAGVFFGDF